MKKNAFIRKTVLLLLTIISVLGLQLISVNAKSPIPSIDKKVYIAIYSAPQSAFGKTIYIENSIEEKEPTGLKNSNPNVVEVLNKGSYGLTVNVKKAGTSTISFKYAGKKLSTIITAYNWKNPCKFFKVGNKNLTSKFNKSRVYNWNKQKKQWKAKISLKANKGWKLKKIQYLYDGVKTTVKNNSVVTFKGDCTGSSLSALFVQDKNGIQTWVELGYSQMDYPSQNVYIRG